jgi:DMSO/TMAO reductase YedYZ molybdopterin-dependent catalytic subunit
MWVVVGAGWTGYTIAPLLCRAGFRGVAGDVTLTHICATTLGMEPKGFSFCAEIVPSCC